MAKGRKLARAFAKGQKNADKTDIHYECKRCGPLRKVTTYTEFQKHIAKCEREAVIAARAAARAAAKAVEAAEPKKKSRH